MVFEIMYKRYNNTKLNQLVDIKYGLQIFCVHIEKSSIQSNKETPVVVNKIVAPEVHAQVEEVNLQRLKLCSMYESSNAI